MLKNGISWFALSLLLISSAYADTTEIDCSTDPVFSQYSCNQCFDWWEKSQGEYIWFLSDIWQNSSANKKVMYKEIQKMPEIYSLDNSKVTWAQVPSSSGFWEYTSELEDFYSSEFEWYVLPPSDKVTWLKSKDDHAYVLDKNGVAQGWNIWLLVYTLNSTNILDNGEVSGDFSDHNECVLYKSGNKTTPTPPKTLPQTGPAEFFLLLILAMVLWFWVLKIRNRNA